MVDSKQLLVRIAGLRARLDDVPAPAPDALQRLEQKVRTGARQQRLLDNTLRPLDPGADGCALPESLTPRSRRVLGKAKDLLAALRELTDEPILAVDDNAPLTGLHRHSVALIDLVLRCVPALPAAASAQVRLCDGLQAMLNVVEEQLDVLTAGLEHRRQEEDRIDQLAELLRWLAVGQSIKVDALAAIADRVSAEAKSGQPLRILHAEPSDPSRFAAAHGLTTAQVMARVLDGDPHWQTQLQLAIMAALVHDVGMVRIPADILNHPGPLSDEQRRLVERHTSTAAPLVKLLWPGGGWPVDSVTDHHERSDGTGYPTGQKEILIDPFVRLLSICDAYAAMAAPRPYRPARDTRTILTDLLLMAEHGRFDRAQAERLLALSFFPVGSVVRLSDGAAAVVIAVRPGAEPNRPVVQLLTAADGVPVPLPTIVDLATQHDRHISRNLNADERRRLLLKKFPQLI